jgi:hypothetical protein
VDPDLVEAVLTANGKEREGKKLRIERARARR